MVALEEIPEDLPEFIDDVEEYLPSHLPESDLVLAVGLSGDINLLVPLIAKKTGARSVIIPIHDPAQLPPGLLREVEDSAPEIRMVFPRPFCMLQPVGDEFIDEFAQKFGKPKVEVEGDSYVKKITVLRGAPCGCTDYIARELEGFPLEEAEQEAGNKFHNYPCLASMKDDTIAGDTLMHIAGYQAKEAIKRSLGYASKSAVVDPEDCEGDECEHACLEHCPQVRCGIDTITLDEDGRAVIDPASCGLCEICIKECPYGAIEIVEGPIKW
jgi:NAD-dependent dihydropyrimidine dehydrogenase PreA subunit